MFIGPVVLRQQVGWNLWSGQYWWQLEFGRNQKHLLEDLVEKDDKFW